MISQYIFIEIQHFHIDVTHSNPPPVKSKRLLCISFIDDVIIDDNLKPTRRSTTRHVVFMINALRYEIPRAQSVTHS